MADFEMSFDDLLNVEFHDPPLVTTNQKRKKVIGLDDLFNDHKKEQEKYKKKKSIVVKGRKFHKFDYDDDDETENKLTEAFHDFQRTIKEVDGNDDALNELERGDMTPSWGLPVFGTQRTASPVVVPELGGCLLLQNSLNDELGAVVDNSSQLGEPFLRGLLLNGWLSKLIINYGYLEESIAKWTLNLMLYSSEESLMTSACDFWCAILLCDKVGVPLVQIEWLPGFAELKRALESFGFQLYSATNMSASIESSHGSEQSNHTSSDCKGPPTNIRAWIKFANACCQIRSRYSVFSTLEAEELVGIFICLFLERQLLGLTVALHDCLLSAINFFEQKEWNSSCEKVAEFLSDRVPRDINCLRVVECISGVDTRSKQLRSAVASQFLKSCYVEMSDAKDILGLLISKNLKDKSCDLFKIYLCLVLTENWFLFGAEPKPTINELWTSFIRKCCSQISNTDFRPCAQEIRNRAAYLLHSTSNE